jgi:hypothetical protein
MQTEEPRTGTLHALASSPPVRELIVRLAEEESVRAMAFGRAARVEIE